jgi:hypothetical protein
MIHIASARPFVRIQNVYFIPIRRNRLAFAVLVRRALHALEPWTSDDLLAVALPRSVCGELTRVVETHLHDDPFPVKLIAARWPGGPFREIFPITPCDGIVEAVRYALENGIRWEGIDREIVPGNLIDRTCLDDPLAADDELALRWGIDSYLRVVERELAVPPTRFDPIDSLREVHMAEALQRLAPVYGRILVLCDAVNFEGIQRHLKTPYRGLSEAPMSGPDLPVTKVMDPPLRTMLRYLDDFPRLTHRFEEMRAAGNAHQFERLTELMHVVQQLGVEAGEGYRSVRRLDVFRRYLFGMLDADRRLSPTPHEVVEAFRGCFGPTRARRLTHELARYGDVVDVERIESTIADHREDYALRDRRQATEDVARSCSSTTPSFGVRKRPARARTGKDIWDSESQSVDSADWVELRRKAIALFQRSEIERRSERFRGSLERGIDARRSLRSLLGPSPGAWVHRHVRTIPAAGLERAPIVWILELEGQHRNWLGTGTLKCTTQLLADQSYCQSSAYQGGPTEVFQSVDGDVRVTASDVLGRVRFFDGEIGAIQAMVGPEFERRVPDHANMSIVDVGTRGCVLDTLVPQAEAGSPWWELLILSAMQHAAGEVLCVVPDRFRPSRELLAAARMSGTMLLFARIQQFSRGEREKMGKSYSVWATSSSFEDKPFKGRITTILQDLGIW